MNGKVRALSRAVRGEQAHTWKADAVESAVDVPEDLPRQLVRPVGAHGAQDRIVLPARDVGGDPVDAGGAGEEELLDVTRADEFQEVLGAANVAVAVAPGVLDGSVVAGTSG